MGTACYSIAPNEEAADPESVQLLNDEKASTETAYDPEKALKYFSSDQIMLPLSQNDCDLDICGAMHRIKYIMYHQEVDMMEYGAYQFINTHLNTYNNIHLLDDYHHLMFVHEYEFEEIYNALSRCDLDKCTSYTRNHRDRSSIDHHDEYSQFIQGLQSENNEDITKEMSTIQIIDVIHCYFLHTFDCLYKLNKEETKKLNAQIEEMYLREQNEQKTNKPSGGQFNAAYKVRAMNEILRNQEKIGAQRGVRFNRITATNKRTLSRYQSNRFCSGRSILADVEDDDDDDDDDDDKDVNHSDDDDEQKYKMDNDNDIMYSFGVRFVYDKDKNHDQWYVAAKWNSLKDELLYNSYGGFQIEQWDQLLVKANMYSESKRIKEDCKQIDVAHLIAIMIYCNFDKLQARFSESYRILKGENNVDLKNKHSEWHQLGKYLREVVEVHGKRIFSEEQRLKRNNENISFLKNVSDRSRKLKFYHGINREMVFISTSARICGPLSTSSEPYVAMNFAGKDGLLMEIQGHNACYFDCCGISDYSNEKEKFFIGGYAALSMTTIINPQTMDYRPYIKAINIISCLFNGQPYHSQSRKQFGKKTKERICLLLFHKNDIHDANMPVLEPYVQKLFYHYSKNVIRIILDWKLMNMNHDRLNPSIKGFRFLEDRLCLKTCECIKMNHIVALFEHLEIIQLNYIKLTKEVMDYILYTLETEGDEPEYQSLNKIIIYEPEQKHGLTVTDAVRIYVNKFKEKQKWTVSVEDMNVVITKLP